MNNFKNHIIPFIPIIGIYLVCKYNILSNKEPFVFFGSAFFQALSIVLLIFYTLIKT